MALKSLVNKHPELPDRNRMIDTATMVRIISKKRLMISIAIFSV